MPSDWHSYFGNATLACPSYSKYHCKYPAAIVDGLRQCGVLTVTSQRLLFLLERYSGLSLASKAVICPNGCRFPPAARIPTQPEGILWSSSDCAALTNSREAVIEAISAFVRRHDLPIYCFGELANSFRVRFPRIVDYGFVPYWQHKFLFATFPTMIGVAPLETHADRETQDFIDGKSDLKLVDFVGFGHPCVCSNVSPYVDTDLSVGTKVENTKDAWTDGLEEVYASKWRDVAGEQEIVTLSRDMRTLATGSWLRAIRKVQMRSPMSVNELRQSRVQSLRREALAFLAAGFEATPGLRRLRDRVPKRFSSAVRRFLNS